MYAVVTLKNSLVNIVIPATWIDGISVHEFANDGCTNSLPFKIFYSTDERKEANFTLVIKDYYEQLVPDSCYIAFFRKFFDTKEQAERYCKRARNILLADYSEKKQSAAKRHYFKAVEVDDDHEIVDDNKQAIQNEIFAKMQGMNDMFIDLSEDEIDRIQEILEYDGESSDDDAYSDQNLVDNTVNGNFKLGGAIDRGTYVNNADSCQSTVDENVNDERSDDDVFSEDGFEWLFNSTTEELPMPLSSKLEVVDDEETNASNVDSDQNTVDDTANDALNLSEVTDHVTYVNNDNSNQSTVDEIVSGASNLVKVKKEAEIANNQNDSGAIPFFSPPSTSNALFSQIPNHFARLDPNLHNLLSKRANDVSNVCKSQMTLEELLAIVKLIFPGQCTYNNMKFCFEEYNVILKTGLVRLLAEWTNSETTSSILYDSRFVQLLVVALFSDDEIINNNFDKKKMNFMKGAFAKRVGQSMQRMMRFFDYIQRCKENAMKKQKKVNQSN